MDLISFVFREENHIVSFKRTKTTVKTEILAGMTTFLTMAYIVIVNPIILADAGVPFDQVFLATIIAAASEPLDGAICKLSNRNCTRNGVECYFTSVVLASDGQLDYMTAFSAVFIAGFICYFIINSFS